MGQRYGAAQLQRLAGVLTGAEAGLPRMDTPQVTWSVLVTLG